MNACLSTLVRARACVCVCVCVCIVNPEDLSRYTYKCFDKHNVKKC